VTFYYRHNDHRTYLVLTTIHEQDGETTHCLPLTSLLIKRRHSVLELVHTISSKRMGVLWATLRFIYYERMVLFYSTFVALKRQDSRKTPRHFIESFATLNEKLLFSGIIRAKGILYALRLLQEPDAGSAIGVYRLEVSPLRGETRDMPIWTAFLSKYVENGGETFFTTSRDSVVTMCCPKPKPTAFVSTWTPPITEQGDYLLEFQMKSGKSVRCHVGF
jgi:hypothetical protein